MTAISLLGVGKRFGKTDALKDINLEIPEGEFVSLIGPSGCGKTTLLRIIADLETPSEGEVKVLGMTPKAARCARKIGMTFQNSALIPSRTAIGNVRLTLEITKCKNGTGPKDLLRAFGLGEFLGHYPHQLSGGMKQRVNIASDLIYNPKVLLLDEPFGALDEITRETMAIWLGEILSETKQTVVFVTHSVDEAVMLSDRILVMTPLPGSIFKEYEVELSHPRRRETRLTAAYHEAVSSVREFLYSTMNGGY